MQDLLDHPMVQAGVAPLLVALLVAAALWRTRWAWVAVVAGYATAVSLATGLSFEPLTAGRKVTLLVLLSPLIGAALDRLVASGVHRWLPAVVAAACGLSTAWVFASVLGQREWGPRLGIAAALALYVGVHTLLTLRLRDDGTGGGAAGVGAGLAVGIAAVLSASIGYLLGGVAMAAGAGALVLLQFVFNRGHAPGYTGALPIGFGLALFAAATSVLAQLPWFALPLLWLIPAVAAAPLLLDKALRMRLLAITALAAAAALPFILAAWFAAGAGSSGVS